MPINIYLHMNVECSHYTTRFTKKTTNSLQDLGVVYILGKYNDFFLVRLRKINVFFGIKIIQT